MKRILASASLLSVVCTSLVHANPALGPWIDSGPNPTEIRIPKGEPDDQRPTIERRTGLSEPVNLRRLGTHPGVLPYQPVQRHRVSCGLNICFDMQMRPGS